MLLQRCRKNNCKMQEIMNPCNKNLINKPILKSLQRKRIFDDEFTWAQPIDRMSCKIGFYNFTFIRVIAYKVV